jgi:hypothetical protein
MGEENVVTRIRRVLRREDEAMKPSHKVVGLLMSVFVATAILVGASARQSASAHTAVPASLDRAGERTLSGGRHVGGLIGETLTPGETGLTQYDRPWHRRPEAAQASAETGGQDEVTLRVVDPSSRQSQCQRRVSCPMEGRKQEFFLRKKQTKIGVR